MEMREYVNSLNLNIGQHLFFTTMRYGELAPLFPGTTGELKNASWYRAKETGILLVSGIANPQGIRTYAKTISGNLKELNFPDHHRYTLKDLERIKQLTMELVEAFGEVLILTTEKDAVKLRELDFPENMRSFMQAVPILVNFLNGDGGDFEKQIHNYVTSNKRGSILHQGEN
jgi:tetraacyldisaccharide 4'-kinase